jgi:hypothetical protein
MENEIEMEFECQICMDIMVEPVTTICGHTFCKICLIRFLKTKLNCPICRKPILQSPESLAKNISFENLIKTKHPKKYEEKLNIVKISYQEEGNTEHNLRRNIPSIYLENTYVWPRTKRKLIIKNMLFNSTIVTSSIHDRFLIIAPYDPNDSTSPNNLNQDSIKISSLVEILSINKHNNQIDLEVIGLKRFKINNLNTTQLSDQTPLYLSIGEIVNDMHITSEEILSDIKNKLSVIADIHHEILQNSTISVQNQLESFYGKAPTRNTIMSDMNMNSNQLEFYSFYFLNLIKNDEKRKFYITNNAIHRVNW